jgi:2-hydroxy-3-keto-5-methylthiopentenyl-1-phosphate phosphatase
MPASARPAPHWRTSRLDTRCHLLIDFDGTIAPDDPTDRLLEQFARPAWLDIEAAWQAGRISSRECMERHTELLRVTPEDLDAAIRCMRIDPSFHAFVDFCRRGSLDLTIVSDGFDRVVRTLLEGEGLPLRFFANRLEWQGGDRWGLEFPHLQVDCRSRAGNCKCSHGVDQPRAHVVVIGDGRSDFCMAERADYVIAKGALAQFCRERGLQHASFHTFDDVTARLARWLARRAHAPRSQSSPLEGQPWGRRN